MFSGWESVGRLSNANGKQATLNAFLAHTTHNVKLYETYVHEAEYTDHVSHSNKRFGSGGHVKFSTRGSRISSDLNCLDIRLVLK